MIRRLKKQFLSPAQVFDQKTEIYSIRSEVNDRVFFLTDSLVVDDKGKYLDNYAIYTVGEILMFSSSETETIARGLKDGLREEFRSFVDDVKDLRSMGVVRKGGMLHG